MNSGIVLRGVFVGLSLLLMAALIGQMGFEYGADDLKRWADAEIRGNGLVGSLAFVAVGALFTGLGLSRQIFAFVAGYLYGALAGTGLALLAEMAGVLAGFAYARLLARGAITARYPRRVRRVDEFLGRHPFSMTLAVRLFPVGNNLLVNLLAGVSRIAVAPFLAASVIGHAPQTLVFGLAGSGVATGDGLQSAVAVVLFAVSIGVGIPLYRKFRSGRVFEAAIEDVMGDGIDDYPDRPGLGER